eukprot:8477636-Karenia_brevis.AAC.2
MEAAVAAAHVVMTPREDLTEGKKREAQALIDKCKGLHKGVIMAWPEEVQEARAKIKKEQEDSRDASSSSGLCLQGPPTAPDPGTSFVLGSNPVLDDRDSNDEAEVCVPMAREHLPDEGDDDDENRSTGNVEMETLTEGTNKLDLSGYKSPDSYD